VGRKLLLLTHRELQLAHDLRQALQGHFTFGLLGASQVSYSRGPPTDQIALVEVEHDGGRPAKELARLAAHRFLQHS
jgi:hypothetical protein